MANVPVWALRPSAAPGEVQGNVYLLAVDSISDLHSAPLDMGTPQEQEVILKAQDEKSTSTPPDTQKDRRADHPAGSSRSPCTNALLTLLIAITLVSMSLLLYILHLYRKQEGFLRTLTERFDAQTDALQRVSTNNTFKGQESR